VISKKQKKSCAGPRDFCFRPCPIHNYREKLQKKKVERRNPALINLFLKIFDIKLLHQSNKVYSLYMIHVRLFFDLDFTSPCEESG
jgi:hypothetical protein